MSYFIRCLFEHRYSLVVEKFALIDIFHYGSNIPSEHIFELIVILSRDIRCSVKKINFHLYVDIYLYLLCKKDMFLKLNYCFNIYAQMRVEARKSKCCISLNVYKNIYVKIQNANRKRFKNLEKVTCVSRESTNLD